MNNSNGGRRALRALVVTAIAGAGLLLTGCAALVPFSSVLGSPSSGPPPLQVHEETSVNLAEDDFVLVRTNVVGTSKGFSLLGFITIYPATLTKAMNRMYNSARMHLGKPQTLAHLIVEQSSSYYILFGIPKVQVRADIVQFRPKSNPVDRVGAKAPPPRGPGVFVN